MKKHPCLRTCVVALLTVTRCPSPACRARSCAGRGRCGDLFLCICRFRLVRGDVREVRSGVRDLGGERRAESGVRGQPLRRGGAGHRSSTTATTRPYRTSRTETELARIGGATTFEAEAEHAVLPGRRPNAALPWNVSSCPTNWTARRWRPTSWPALRATWPSM